MTSVLIPKDYLRCIVAEDRNGRWLAEVFVKRKDKTFFIKVNRVESSPQVIGPLRVEDLKSIEKAISDVQWAARTGFANVIPDPETS